MQALRARQLVGGVLCACAVWIGGTGVAAARDVVVFAAASLKTALDEVAEKFALDTGTSVVTSFAGSSVLARQISFGAPADVFISASSEWMDQLQTSGHITADSRFDLLSNRLVLIAHGAGAPAVDVSPEMDVLNMLKGGRLAMALVDAVPAGIYGKAALTSLGLWPTVAPHLAQTDNVRAALALVAAGEAPLGIVYATDATASDAVTVVGTFPAESHPPIIYPVAATASSTHPETAAFLRFLRGPEARAAFVRQGFVVVTE